MRRHACLSLLALLFVFACAYCSPKEVQTDNSKFAEFVAQFRKPSYPVLIAFPALDQITLSDHVLLTWEQSKMFLRDLDLTRSANALVFREMLAATAPPVLDSGLPRLQLFFGHLFVRTQEQVLATLHLYYPGGESCGTEMVLTTVLVNFDAQGQLRHSLVLAEDTVFADVPSFAEESNRIVISSPEHFHVSTTHKLGEYGDDGGKTIKSEHLFFKDVRMDEHGQFQAMDRVFFTMTVQNQPVQVNVLWENNVISRLHFIISDKESKLQQLFDLKGKSIALSLAMQDDFFSAQDANGDGHNDFILLTEIAGTQRKKDVYLFDPNTNQFVYNTELRQ